MTFEFASHKEKLAKTKVTLKKISFILAACATFLLLLDTIHIFMVDKIEKGLLDFMPASLISILFILYPVLLLTSYILFIASKNIKGRFDFVLIILFLLNGLAILLLTVISITTILQNL